MKLAYLPVYLVGKSLDMVLPGHIYLCPAQYRNRCPEGQKVRDPKTVYAVLSTTEPLITDFLNT